MAAESTTTGLAGIEGPRPFLEWIRSIKHELKPPVANKLMYGAGQLKVMIVGGPNKRADYHIEQGAEFFWQLEGTLVLDIIEDGAKRSVAVRAGEALLLPAGIPHSPQREEGSVGLVVERERLAEEVDTLRWYVPGEEGSRVLYQEHFHCTDLGTQLKPVIERFFASEAYRTSEPPADLDGSDKVPLSSARVMGPIAFRDWFSESRGDAKTLFEGGEFRIDVAGATRWAEGVRPRGEVLVFAVDGAVGVTVTAEGESRLETVEKGSVFLLPRLPGSCVRLSWPEDGSFAFVVTNDVVAA